MSSQEKINERQKLIDKTFRSLGRTEAAVHVIAENWSNLENERLNIQVRDLTIKLNELKSKRYEH